MASSGLSAEQMETARGVIFAELYRAASRYQRFCAPMTDAERDAQMPNKQALITALGHVPAFAPRNELELERWVDDVGAKVRMRRMHQTIFKEAWQYAATQDFAAVIERANDATYEGMVNEVALELFPNSTVVRQVERWFLKPDRKSTVRHALTTVAHTASLYIRLADRHGRTITICNDQMRDCYLGTLPQHVARKLHEFNRDRSVNDIVTYAATYELSETHDDETYVTTHGQIAPLVPLTSSVPPPPNDPNKRPRTDSDSDVDMKEAKELSKRIASRCPGCLGRHFRKNCPYKKTRCNKCQQIGHIELACFAWVRKDAKGRVDAKMEEKPGGYDFQVRTDRTKRDKVQTAELNIQEMLARILKNTEKDRERRKKIQGEKIAKGLRPPLRPEPVRQPDPGLKAAMMLPEQKEEMARLEDDEEAVVPTAVINVPQEIIATPAMLSRGRNGTPKGIFIPVEIDFIQYSAFLDTGAWFSVMDTKLAEKHGIESSKRTYKLVGLGTADAEKSMPVKCMVSGIEMEIEFIILPDFNFEVLIGLQDLLTRYTEETTSIQVSLEPQECIGVTPLKDVASGIDETKTDLELMDLHRLTLLENCGIDDEDFFAELWRILQHYSQCWLRPRSGQFTGEQAVIEPIAPPCKQARRPLSPAKKEEVERQLASQLEAGIIRPSKSPWASPLHLVTKADGTWRIVVDYREMNKRIKADTYPLPLISEIQHEISGYKWYAILDLNWGFWNLPITEESKECTAFCTHLGLFEFNVLPFGMKNSPAEFQRMSDYVWGHLYKDNVKVYIDDIIIFDNTLDGLLDHLSEVLDAAVHHGVYFKLSKCRIAHREIKILGSLVSEDGIRCDPARIEVLQKAQQPRSKKELVSFLATCSYMRQHIPNYATVTSPLYDLVNKRTQFVWE